MFFIIINFTFLNEVKAITFANYLELSGCLDVYNSLEKYKKNLKNCYKEKNIEIDHNIIDKINNNKSVIDSIIKIDYSVVEKENSLKEVFFPKKTKQNLFPLNKKSFKNLNTYIKRNPADIYTLTEDINNLTYKNKLISEFKRKEILLNIYNSFSPKLIKPKINLSAAGTPPQGVGVAGIIGLVAIAGGGGGGGGGPYVPPTISFSVSSATVAECDNAITITGSLTKAHNSNVTITYSTSGTATNSTDYSLSSTTSTIVAGSTSGSITLTPVNDTTNETSETVIVTASTSDVSTTGNTSTTITIHDYVLKCNSTAYSEGSTSSQNTIKNASNWTASEAGGATHAYEQMGIHKVHSFSSGGTSLTGVGETIHVADFNCDDTHDIYNNKTITNLDDGDAGESTFSAADANDNHCQGVAMFAAGDSGARTGVAPDADLVLSSIPDVQGSNEGDDYAADLDAARAAGAIASNQSWTYNVSGSPYNITELETDISSNGWTAAQGLANLMHGGTSGQALTDANTYVTALNNFEDSGVVVWAAANTTSESDANALGGLPEIFSQLGEAWIVANVIQYTGDDDLSDATSSEFTLRGNPCGSTAAYCLSVDGWDVYAATYVNSGTSMYNTSRISFGSSWSAPMVSGGVALMAQAFPNHTPEQLVDRILASANNVWFTPTGETTFTTHGASIKHGYHSTWGHGVPDFYAAMSPITTDKNPLSLGGGGGGGGSGGGGGGGGGSAVPFSEIKKYAVSSTSLSTSSSLGDAIYNGLENKTVYAYDALNGGFKLNISDFISYNNLEEQNIKASLAEEFNNLRNFNYKIDNNILETDFNNFSGEFINFRDKDNKGISVTLDQPNIALQNFNLYNNSTYNNPFVSKNKGLGFNNKFYFLGNDILIGYNNSKVNPLTNINKDLVVPLETLAMSVNLDQNYFDLLSFTTGFMKEENTFLLSKTEGAFNMNNNGNLSNFYGLNLSKKLNNFGNLNISTMVGNTKTNNNLSSIIVNSSDIISSSFKINYELKNMFKNDQLNISLSQPNRVESGDMTFRLMGLADKNGILPYKDYKIDLKPSGRQKDLTISYYKNNSINFKTGIKAVITDDLGHHNKSGLDKEIFLSTSFSF